MVGLAALSIVTLVGFIFVIRTLYNHYRYNVELEDRLEELETLVLPTKDEHQYYFKPQAKKKEEE